MRPSKYTAIVVICTVTVSGAIAALAMGKDLLAGSIVALGLALAKAIGGGKDPNAGA